MKLTTELTLNIYIDGSPEQTRNVAQDQLILGRLPECDVYLPYSEISRRHCQFRRIAEGKWRVEDLGSTNGTLVNQVRIEKPKLIKDGDIVQLGNVTIKVKLVTNSAVASPEAPPVPQEQSNTESKTILRNVEELQQRWIEGGQGKDPLSTDEITHARLKHIFHIANELNSAESIEAIFHQVEKVIFEGFSNIERLGLLIDDGSGELNLYKAAVRKRLGNDNKDHSSQKSMNLYEKDWISDSICNKVFQEKVAIKTQNAQVDQRFSDEKSILMKGIGGALAVPLWKNKSDREVVGVLYADASTGFNDLDPNHDDDLSFFSTIANLVAASVQRWLLTQRLQKQERIRQRLERYHSPAVAQQLITLSEKDSWLTPMEADVSVLFADIVGFTALSEQLSPEELAKLLNCFFEEMLKPLFSMGGTLDKFIGDCIMAFFGAPEPQSDHADRAVKTAQGMLERLKHLNERKSLSHPLQLRIAINSGKAIVGDVGSSQRVDYTVLGGTVNLASRLETVCRPGACVISEETYRRLDDQQAFYPIGKSKFKGIDRPITVYCARW